MIYRLRRIKKQTAYAVCFLKSNIIFTVTGGIEGFHIDFLGGGIQLFADDFDHLIADGSVLEKGCESNLPFSFVFLVFVI